MGMMMIILVVFTIFSCKEFSTIFDILDTVEPSYWFLKRLISTTRALQIEFC